MYAIRERERERVFILLIVLFKTNTIYFYLCRDISQILSLLNQRQKQQVEPTVAAPSPINKDKYVELKIVDDSKFNYFNKQDIIDLETKGYLVKDQFLTNTKDQQEQQQLSIQDIYLECDGLYESKKLKEANMSRGDGKWNDKSIRSDSLVWLNKETNKDLQEGRLPNISKLLQRIDNLRIELNNTINYASEKTQTQLAIYPNGGRYVKHCDSFLGGNSRRITIIYYLNYEWKQQDGGQLRLYDGRNGSTSDVDPIGDRVLIFLSEHIEHEVLESNCDKRMAITTWLY
ncbi:prolyl 4-hydroxylase [Cavenderia fasciculata]|uniref:Prolyl 4-hydroxylase n=1 Tax=Cavenderia fasciculata TaxID=261658 RepID=F4PJA6_CACFS|nr:prolyl 4-hydroxylase [Cavenderia fasciculata]EGG24392.1 prolyl 4-hydroxylase [Cavenderia fasciculata]|eukprot:XP_004362243.1 prolyl 4-hydroxylase [Cavenderia fasciculata]